MSLLEFLFSNFLYLEFLVFLQDDKILEHGSLFHGHELLLGQFRSKRG